MEPSARSLRDSLAAPLRRIVTLTVPGASSLVRRSCPVMQDGRPEKAEICLRFSRSTRQSNPLRLIQHGNPTVKSSDEFMGYDKIYLKTLHLSTVLNVTHRGVDRGNYFLYVFAKTYSEGEVGNGRG